jgi:F-type H+-transporting ATPase subunit gamma
MRTRINAVRATRKITSAMKLVAGSKLRRAQEHAEAARPFAAKMAAMLANLAAAVKDRGEAPPLLAGTGKDEVHLLVVATADRGLCGAFNSSIVRAARRRIQDLKEQGKTVKLLCVGRKGRDMLRREYGDLIVEFIDGIAGKRRIGFADAERIAQKILQLYEAGEFDVATMIFSRFKSAMSQIVTFKQLVPVEAPDAAAGEGVQAIYEFEPDEERILAELLPRNLAVQIYGALLENAASEQGARMVAMDNATRNAGEMIDRLTLRYNRQRQANITKELIEIVSGAEAV